MIGISKFWLDFHTNSRSFTISTKISFVAVFRPHRKTLETAARKKIRKKKANSSLIMSL